MSTLKALAKQYGMDTLFEMVSDSWGDPCLITPREAIAMHKQVGWDASGYRVMHGDEPGDVVLVDATGNAILQVCGERGE